MLDLVIPAALQHVHETLQIRLGEGLRIDDGMAHADLGGQVDHTPGLFPFEQRRERCSIFHGQHGEAKARLGLESRQPRQLERGVVVSVEIVYAHHLLTTGEQDGSHVHADEAGGASDQDFQSSMSYLTARPGGVGFHAVGGA